jgi:hypothetical protein
MKGLDALILSAGPAGKPKAGGEDMPGESANGAGVRAMRALGAALASKDYGKAYSALEHAVSLCTSGHAEPDEDDAMGEGEESEV